MADFQKHSMGGLPKDFPKNQMGTDESKPCDVGHDGKNPKDPFNGASSNGPWVTDAAKKGSGGTNEWDKISKLADDHSATYTSKK